MSIKKGKDTRAHRYLRLVSKLERRLDSRLLTGLHLRYYYQTRTFTSGELQNECYFCVFSHRGAYMGVEGSLHQLVKVGLEQMGGRPAIHVAGRPLLLASTAFKSRILPCEPT
jgi:hypothetical protein